jgi:hypothetical protein
MGGKSCHAILAETTPAIKEGTTVSNIVDRVPFIKSVSLLMSVPGTAPKNNGQTGLKTR